MGRKLNALFHYTHGETIGSLVGQLLLYEPPTTPVCTYMGDIIVSCRLWKACRSLACISMSLPARLWLNIYTQVSPTCDLFIKSTCGGNTWYCAGPPHWRLTLSLVCRSSTGTCSTESCR
jgi:hypothetical protein